jgi:hypothetical protein
MRTRERTPVIIGRGRWEEKNEGKEGGSGREQ